MRVSNNVNVVSVRADDLSVVRHAQPLCDESTVVSKDVRVLRERAIYSVMCVVIRTNAGTGREQIEW